jgi:hypothetical protein
MVLLSAINLRWRARTEAGWVIPFARAQSEFWRAWGLGFGVLVVAGIILGLLNLRTNAVHLLTGCLSWVVAYYVLRGRLPKIAAATGVVVGTEQIKRISTQVFALLLLYETVIAVIFVIAAGMGMEGFLNHSSSLLSDRTRSHSHRWWLIRLLALNGDASTDRTGRRDPVTRPMTAGTS